MLPGTAEIVRALYGCWCLALGRPGAIDMFDRSEAGFYRSFFAAVLALPAILISDVANGSAAWISGDFFDWISYGLRYAVYWLVFPLVACLIAEKIGKLDLILDFLVPYNWVTVPFAYIFCCFYVFGSGEGAVADFFDTLTVILWLGLLFIVWRWARRLLGVSPLMAAGFILADELCSTVTFLILENIAALS
ncbi:hypothetical protein NUH88_09805 [Nisaea acidiphila]|uniref:Yip1 domain-containing protein n=1 Tax=Nisaea acidiphila TaxID=1862145 RepID=A0A9J7B2V6_9PROT|nr:hypothetical protein [Nisaea acidiphila]UUX51981.1 hypothetical protein NUH88_09805 [Nisaea acidiphila]